MPEQDAGGDLYLSDVSPKDKPWDKHRASADRVQAIYSNCDYSRYAERMGLCSQQLGFALEAQDTGELRLRLRQARFCRVRFCPTCQWRRSMMWRARFFKVLPKVLEEHPKARFLFLTLTVRNCPVEELRDTVKLMNAAWKRLSERKRFPAQGWIKAIEVTRNDKTGFAHPHIHAILMVKPSYFSGKTYIKQSEWVELWQSCLRADYRPGVDVRTVKPKDAAPDDAASAGLLEALLETFKYGVKPSDLVADGSWLIEVTNQLHKTRAVAIGGILRNYLSEEDPEDLIHGDENPEEEEVSEVDELLWVGWREMVQRYAKIAKK